MEGQNNQIQSLEDLSFDLGEIGGGRQLIIHDLAANDQVHYVFTIGNKSKLDELQQPKANDKKNIGRQLFDSILKLANGNKNAQPKTEEEFENIRIRCFRLTLQEQGGYQVEEIVDPEKVSDVARAMGYGDAN